MDSSDFNTAEIPAVSVVSEIDDLLPLAHPILPKPKIRRTSSSESSTEASSAKEAGPTILSAYSPHVKPATAAQKWFTRPTAIFDQRANDVQRLFSRLSEMNFEDRCRNFVLGLKQIGIKVLVFDFDKTAAAGSVGYIHHGDDFPTLTEGFCRVAHYAAQEGMPLWIATWGDPESWTKPNTTSGPALINGSVQKALLHRPDLRFSEFPIVYAFPPLHRRTNPHLEMPVNKNWHLQQIGRKTGTDPQDMILFDDIYRNPEQATFMGTQGVHVGPGGFDPGALRVTHRPVEPKRVRRRYN